MTNTGKLPRAKFPIIPPNTPPEAIERHRKAYDEVSALLDAWENSATASELEELEAGGIPASWLAMMVAVTRISDKYLAMTNTGNSTPPKTPQTRFNNYIQVVTQEVYDAWADSDSEQIAERKWNLDKAQRLYDAWEASATVSELEELKAGGTPESFRVMREAFLNLVGYNGPIPD